MNVKSFNASVDQNHGYSAFIDATLDTPYGEASITLHVSNSDGSPRNLAKCLFGLAEDTMSVLIDAEGIDSRAEDF